jgi:hypothetical protein
MHAIATVRVNTIFAKTAARPKKNGRKKYDSNLLSL